MNFSDGEPAFSFSSGLGYNCYYSSENGGRHTRKQVNEIRKKGYKVLSYFIDIRKGTTENRTFKMMYGQDARFIDVTNIVSVAKTLNDMFLSSSSKI